MVDLSPNYTPGKDYLQPNKSVCGILLKPYCSNNCVFCRPPGENSRISVQQLKKLGQDIAQSIKGFRKKGYRYVEVSGGDPLEYNKLPGLIKTLRDNGFQWIRIATNGVRLSDPAFLDKLIKCGIDVFKIPLYGSNAKIHDSVTRAKGSFKHTLQGIKNLKKSTKKTKILLTTLLLKQNAQDMPAIFDFMHELGCDDLYFSPVFISNNDYSYYIPHKFQGLFFRKLIRYAQNSRRPIYFKDVPYCVIGFDNDYTVNTGKPAHLGSRFQPPLYQKTEIIDLPAYRQKIKTKICKSCAVSFKCDGLLMNDILRYGTGNLRGINSTIK